MVVFEEKKRRVEWQLATKTLGVNPREFLTLARDEYARAVVEDTSRHTN